MWKTLLILILLVGTLWWFFFREKTGDIIVQTNTETIVLENLSALEYKKYVRLAQARNIWVLPSKQEVENTETQTVKNDTSISIYKIDKNGKLVEDIQTLSLGEKPTQEIPQLLSFAGDFPTSLEGDLSLNTQGAIQNISGIQVPDLTSGGSGGTGNGGLIFDPPLVLGDPEPASGNMKFGTWRGEL